MLTTVTKARRLVPSPFTCVIERALVGGHPEAVRRIPSRREKFFDSYINDLIDRDIRQLSEIQRRPDLIRLLALLADRMPTTISVQNISETIASPKSTVDRYMALLEAVFVFKRLSVWATSATAGQCRRRSVFSSIVRSVSPCWFDFDVAPSNKAASGRLLEGFVTGGFLSSLGGPERQLGRTTIAIEMGVKWT